uniref:Putative secreted protein n=1 Tax=Xenopsylla cheopis TaxID=163159 RepID=A0A6M2E010_XENCH
MKYLMVFVLALIALFATATAAAVEGQVEAQVPEVPEVPKVPEVTKDSKIPETRLSCQIGGIVGCSAHCIALHKPGGYCKNGVCYCF